MCRAAVSQPHPQLLTPGQRAKWVRAASARQGRHRSRRPLTTAVTAQGQSLLPPRPGLLPALLARGGSRAPPPAYTTPSERWLRQATSSVTSRVTSTGTAMKGQRTLLGGSCTALPVAGQAWK